MKVNKREKNEILRGTVVHIILLLVFGATIFLVIYPKIGEFSEKKEELISVHDNLIQIKNKGISYNEFKNISQGAEYSKDTYTKTLLRNITQSFYTKNFTNTGSGDFNTYIAGIEENITSIKNSEEYLKKESAVKKILPVYSKDSSLEEATLTDFYFINYIENLLYSFNIAAEGEIGIGEILRVGSDKSGNKSSSVMDENGQIIPEMSNTLDEEIYKIPLKFEITGGKNDIIEFIHFFENVGSIDIDNMDFSVYSDKFIPKLLDGEKYMTSYNIYDNQVADISSVSMSEYPDSSTIGRNDDPDIITLMRTTQTRERFTVSIELNFYVAGIPGYRMQKYIQDFAQAFNDLQLTVSASSQKYTAAASGFNSGDKIQAVNAIQSLDGLLLKLKGESQQLIIASQQGASIAQAYEKAIDYKNQVNKIEQNYKKQIEILEGKS